MYIVEFSYKNEEEKKYYLMGDAIIKYNVKINGRRPVLARILFVANGIMDARPEPATERELETLYKDIDYVLHPQDRRIEYQNDTIEEMFKEIEDGSYR